MEEWHKGALSLFKKSPFLRFSHSCLPAATRVRGTVIQGRCPGHTSSGHRVAGRGLHDKGGGQVQGVGECVGDEPAHLPRASAM